MTQPSDLDSVPSDPIYIRPDITDEVVQEEPGVIEQESEGSFQDLYKLQRDEFHVMQNLFRMNNRNVTPDRTFIEGLEFNKIQEDLRVSGVDLSEDNLEWLGQAENQEDYNWRLNRAMQKQKVYEEMSKVGGLKGFAASLAAAASDPVGFALDAAAGGSSKAGILTRFLESGGRAAAADLAIEGLRLADGEDLDLQEFAIGTLAAFGMGGALGIPGNKQAVLKQELEAQEILVQNLRDLKDSAGAARNTDLPGGLFGDDTGSVTDELVDRVIEEGLPTPRFSGVRMDAANAGQKSGDVTVRKALQDIHGAGVERKGVVREIPLEVESHRLKDKFSRDYNMSFVQTFTAHQKKQGKGLVKRQFDHLEAQRFSKEVGQYMMGLKDDVSDEVKAAAEAAFRNFDGVKKYAIESGRFTSEDFISGGRYMPNVFARGGVERIAQKANLRKPEQLKPLFVKAIRQGREAAGLEIDDQLTDVVATAYLQRAMSAGKKGQPDSALNSIDLNDSEELLRLIDEFIPEGDRENARQIVESATGSKRTTEDKPDRMQGRLLMDRDVTMEFNGVEVSLKELFEDDINKLVNSYNNQMSGELALRSRGWTGRKFERFIQEKQQTANANQGSADVTGQLDPINATQADVDKLQFALDRIMHKGVTTDNEIVDGMFRVSGNHVFSSKMAGAGLNAISEAGTVIAHAGLKNFVRDLPEMKQLIRAIRTGKADSPMIADLSTMTGGAASRFMANRAKFNIQDDLNLVQGGVLGKAERLTDGFRRTTDALSGLTFLTDTTTAMASQVHATHLMNFGMGKKMPRWWDARAKAWGLTPEREALIKAHMQSDQVKLNAIGGVEDLGNMNFATQEAFEAVMYRMNTNAIQKVFSGDLPKWMQNPYGAFMMKFRSFVTAAWVRHTLEDINMRDTLAAQKLLFTGGLGMMMYAVRQALTHPHDEQKLKEQLTLDKALRSGATYAVNASLIPAITDTIAEVVGGSKVIDKQRTSGLSSSFGSSVTDFVSNIPGISMAADIERSVKAGFTLARGGELSKSQVRALASVLMLDTFYGTRALRAAAVDAAPSDREADQNILNFNED